MSFLSTGAVRLLKPVVSFTIGSLSNLMTSAVLYGIVYIAVADRIIKLFEGGR
jgi:hypothetical protein